MPTKTEFTDAELLRYSRHILLPNVDVSGQLAIANGRVMVLGLGGLGSPVALYLAASGVGHLTLVDDDQVDLGNLQRQIAHREETLGWPKVRSAETALLGLNSTIQVTSIQSRLTEKELVRQLSGVDVLVDCSDNFATRTLINRACVQTRTPLVSGAAIRMEGQLTVFDSRKPESPCYQCLYHLTGEQQLSCSEAGVLSPLVGLIGSAQALEVLKLLAGFGQTLVGRVQIYDGASAQWREFRLKRDPHCPICGTP